VRIDHVIYGTADLDLATARVEADLGLTAVPGGRHEGVGTHNRIVPLGDRSFIELLAVADAREAAGSELGAALVAAIARREGLLAWAIEVAGDPRRIEDWLDGADLPVRVVAGEPSVRAVGIGERELRTA
jgi:hypothetical protein